MVPKERDSETGLHYYGARYYDSKLGIWLSVDPLLDKYPGLSPYNYCMNNPMKYVDPDGKEIKFAPGSSKHFRNAFNQAVTYLKQHNALGPLADVINSKEVIILKESKLDKYNPKTNTISWAPNLGVLTNTGNVILPATALVHEADHAYYDIRNPEELQKRINQKDANYGNSEEKRVITGSETETARKLGEIGPKEVTRTNHSGLPVKTTSPNSTELQMQIIIKPKEE